MGNAVTEHEQTPDPDASDLDASDLGLGVDEEDDGGRRHRGFIGCLLPLLVLGSAVALVVFGGIKGVDWVKSQFGDPEDYAGPGTGSVTVRVYEGDSATDIGRELEEKGVVASVEAFVEAAKHRTDEAAGIQPGSYEMKRKMKADDALSVLVDHENAMVARVTIPEGLRAVDIVDVLAENTDFPKRAFQKVLDQPGKLGLPPYAEGNPEGYLFPATYDFSPDDKPADMLRQMVARWQQSAQEADLGERAKALGYTPHEVMTIASLVEAEGRGDDMPKVARVIYNRLENPGTAGTTGKLEIDATVNYALGRNLGVALSPDELNVDSPYNTRRYKGLPPGPIESPGDAAIEAALNPSDGDWYYYVTVNLKTGETKFAETFDEFLQYKSEYQEYCSSSEAC